MALKFKNIKNVAMGSVLVLSGMVGPSAFADEESMQIPVGFDERPQFELTKIDLTNNKLDFGMTQVRLPGEIQDFGAWIVKDDNVADSEELGEDALLRAFSNAGIGADNYYRYSVSTTKHYVVPAEINLLEESTGKILYMTELLDGTVWAHLIDYSECLSGWTFGKACVADTFERDSNWNVTEINYVLADVEIEPEETEEPGESDEPVVPDDPGVTDESGGLNESGVTDIPGEPDEPGTTDESGVPDKSGEIKESGVPDDIRESENMESNNRQENLSGNEPENLSRDDGLKDDGPARVDDADNFSNLATTGNPDGAGNYNTASSSNMVDTSDTNEETNESKEVEEGAGNTTLEVPELGKKTESENTLQNLTWLLIFLAGALTGALSTWFLLSDHRKMSKNRE